MRHCLTEIIRHMDRLDCDIFFRPDCLRYAVLWVLFEIILFDFLHQILHACRLDLLIHRKLVHKIYFHITNNAAFIYSNMESLP